MSGVLILDITGFFGFGASVHHQTHWSGLVPYLWDCRYGNVVCRALRVCLCD